MSLSCSLVCIISSWCCTQIWLTFPGRTCLVTGVSKPFVATLLWGADLACSSVNWTDYIGQPIDVSTLSLVLFSCWALIGQFGFLYDVYTIIHHYTPISRYIQVVVNSAKSNRSWDRLVFEHSAAWCRLRRVPPTLDGGMLLPRVLCLPVLDFHGTLAEQKQRKHADRQLSWAMHIIRRWGFLVHGQILALPNRTLAVWHPKL